MKMDILNIQINHLHEPIGFQLQTIHVSFEIKAKKIEEINKQVIIKNGEEIVFCTNYEKYDSNTFDCLFSMNPRTRYEVQVNIQRMNGEIISKSTFFETGKMQEEFQANWIANPDKSIQNTLFRKKINVTKPIEKARLYMTA
jgi:alpha-L-rhamnosidase